MENIGLKLAQSNDACLVTEIQKTSFMPLYEKYRDDISPVFDTPEMIAERIETSDYYIIYSGEESVGGIRVVGNSDDDTFRISPVFLVPSVQDKGVGTKVMRLVFNKYPQAKKWSLATIKEEKRNCHFYENLGFVPTGEEKRVNENMTLVFYEKTV